MVYSVAGISAADTVADMKASSLPMVTMSRTIGRRRRVTGSEVSSAAAIAGNAEFFAPLMETEPCSGFPPRIRNLSILSLFSESCSKVALRFLQFFLRCGGGDFFLQHDQRGSLVGATLTQRGFDGPR